MTMKSTSALALLLLIVAAATTSTWAHDVDGPCECEAPSCEGIVAERVAQAEATAMEAFSIQKANVLHQLEIAQSQIQQLEEASTQVAKELEETLELTREELALAQTTLTQVMEREASFKLETEELLASLQQQVQDLASHKIKASELEDHVSMLIESHQAELDLSTQQQNKDRDVHNNLLKETNAKYAKAREELEAAKERMNHLHEKITTTYVNTTLIYNDALVTTHKVKNQLLELYVQTRETLIPLYEASMEVIAPLLEQIKALYTKHVAPHVNAARTQIEDLYDEHAKELIDTKLVPALKPIWDPIKLYSIQGYYAVIAGLEKLCDSTHFYLEKEEAPAWLVANVAYCSSHGTTMVHSFAWFLVILIVLHVMWPKKKKAVLTTPKPTSVTFGAATNGQSKKRHKVKSQ